MKLSDDCPCPSLFKDVAFCPDCPYRATQGGKSTYAPDPKPVKKPKKKGK